MACEPSMTQETPDPFTLPDVDLRGLEYMPLYGDRLFGSVTWLRASPEAKVAALRLWWHAYAKECPAASLPDDDALLAEYAGYGVAIKAWLKIKNAAMRGWVKCTDGRWHHKVLAEVAKEAWIFRKRARDRKRDWRKRHGIGNGDSDGKGTGTEGVGKESEGSDREGTDDKKESPPTPQGGGRDDPKTDLLGKQPDAEAESDLDPPVAIDRSQAGEAARAWNAMAKAHGLPQITKLTPDRKRKFDARIKDLGGVEQCRRAIERVPKNPFNLGQNERGWTADIEWFLRPGKALKLLESGGVEPSSTPPNPNDPAEAGARKFLDAIGAWERGGQQGDRPRREQFVNEAA